MASATPQQMWATAYAEDGFVILSNLLGTDTLDRLRRAMDRFLKDPFTPVIPSERSSHGEAMREITDPPLLRQNSLRTPESAAVKSVSLR